MASVEAQARPAGRPSWLERAWTSVRAEPLLVGLVVLAAVLRFATIDQQSYWLDEAFTVGLLREDFPHMLKYMTETEATPPLYYVLAWPWAHVFGTGEIALRSFSAVIGTATVPLMYAAGKELVSRRAGLIAAALTTTSPLMIWYSQEARAYALLVLFGAASLWFFARVLNNPTRGNYVLFGVCSGLAILSHYLAGLLFVAEAVVLYWDPARRHATRRLVAAYALLCAALVPLVLIEDPQVRTQYRAISLVSRGKEVASEFAFGRASYEHPFFFWPSLALVGLLAAGVVWVLTTEERSRALLAFGLSLGVLVPALALHFLGQNFDYFHYRPLIEAWVPAAVGVAAVLAAKRLGRAGIALAVLACAISTAAEADILLQPRVQREDWRGVMALIGPRDRDRAFFILPWFPTSTSELYRPTVDLPAQGAKVREVVFIFEFTKRPLVINSEHPPFHPPKGFRLVERKRHQLFQLSRFVADKPTLVRAQDVVPRLQFRSSGRLDRVPAHQASPKRVNPE
jgi:hypothetical protein